MKANKKNLKKEKSLNRKKTSALLTSALLILLVATTGIQNFPESTESRSDLTYFCYMTPLEATVSSRTCIFTDVSRLKDSYNFVNHLKKALLPAKESPLFWNMETSTAWEPFFNDDPETKTHLSPLKDEVLEAMYKKHIAEVDLAIELVWERKNQSFEEPLALEYWMTDVEIWPQAVPQNDEIDPLLAKMAKEEESKVFDSLERVRQLRELLTIEEETPLQMEAWICEYISAGPLEKDRDTDPYLAKLVKAKNEKVFLVLQLQTKCRELLALDEEPALCLEEWMTDEACWCPGKKQTETISPVSYAMKSIE